MAASRRSDARSAGGRPDRDARSGRAREARSRSVSDRLAQTNIALKPLYPIVVGDSVWDMLAARRAHALGVGLLSGGYGPRTLERAGAYRVYSDPAEMLSRLDEIGVRLDDNAAG